MDEILQIIDKARNLPMDHEPNVSDMWDMINAIERWVSSPKVLFCWNVALGAFVRAHLWRPSKGICLWYRSLSPVPAK